MPWHTCVEDRFYMAIESDHRFFKLDEVYLNGDSVVRILKIQNLFSFPINLSLSSSFVTNESIVCNVQFQPQNIVNDIAIPETTLLNELIKQTGALNEVLLIKKKAIIYVCYFSNNSSFLKNDTTAEKNCIILLLHSYTLY